MRAPLLSSSVLSRYVVAQDPPHVALRREFFARLETRRKGRRKIVIVSTFQDKRVRFLLTKARLDLIFRPIPTPNNKTACARRQNAEKMQSFFTAKSLENRPKTWLKRVDMKGKLGLGLSALKKAGVADEWTKWSLENRPKPG